MYSDTELNGVTGVLAAALQYRDMAERPDREPSPHSRHAGRGNGEKGGAPTPAKSSAADIAALVEYEKAAAALEVEQRLRKEYDQKLVAERAVVTELITGFEEQRSDYYARVEAEVVQLALAIAAKILHRRIAGRPHAGGGTGSNRRGEDARGFQL